MANTINNTFNGINTIADRLNAQKEHAAKVADLKALGEELEKVEPAGFMDMYKSIKKGEFATITDENGNLVGVNHVVKPSGAITCTKMVGSHVTIGASEDERKADELALRKFQAAYAGKPVMSYVILATQLIAAGLVPDDAIEDGDIYTLYFADKVARDSDGDVIAELDIEDKLPDAVVKMMLEDKVKLYIAEHKCDCCCDDEDYDEDYEDDDYEDEEDW